MTTTWFAQAETLRHAMRHSSNFSDILDAFTDHLGFNASFLRASQPHAAPDLTSTVQNVVARAIGHNATLLCTHFCREPVTKIVHGTFVVRAVNDGRRFDSVGMAVYQEQEGVGVVGLQGAFGDQRIVCARFSYLNTVGPYSIVAGGSA